MNTAEIKSRIKNYIEHADERILRIFNAIIEVEATHLPSSRAGQAETSLKHQKHPSEEEISREDGIGSLKDDHRLK